MRYRIMRVVTKNYKFSYYIAQRLRFWGLYWDTVKGYESMYSEFAPIRFSTEAEAAAYIYEEKARLATSSSYVVREI